MKVSKESLVAKATPLINGEPITVLRGKRVYGADHKKLGAVYEIGANGFTMARTLRFWHGRAHHLLSDIDFVTDNEVILKPLVDEIESCKNNLPDEPPFEDDEPPFAGRYFIL
jgi:hypothetical protein